MFEINFCAQSGQCFQMQIDGSGPDGASTGKGDTGFFQPGDQRAEYENRGSHFSHQIVRGFWIGKISSIDGNTIFCRLNRGAMVLQQNTCALNILEIRHIGIGIFPVCQQRRHQNGQRRIFGAADDNVSGKPAAAVDNDFIHNSPAKFCNKFKSKQKRFSTS